MNKVKSTVLPVMLFITLALDLALFLKLKGQFNSVPFYIAFSSSFVIIAIAFIISAINCAMHYDGIPVKRVGKDHTIKLSEQDQQVVLFLPILPKTISKLDTESNIIDFSCDRVNYAEQYMLSIKQKMVQSCRANIQRYC